MSKAYDNFGMEMRLRELDPALHKRFTDTVSVTANLLFRYKRYFPEYNDHSGLHSMSVIDLCNQLIGAEQILRLNQDELYILLMSCHLHDVGMGITSKEYDEFREQIDFGNYFEDHPDAPLDRVIRDFHQEFSALFIEKHAGFLELPSEAHLYAVMQVVRGHRKTDLFDRNEFPTDFTLPDGSTVCLPYLAALIRLADEVDVDALRSTVLLFDVDSFESEEEVMYYYRTRACERIEIIRDAIIMHVRTEDPAVKEALEKLQDKILETLELCRKVVETTPYTLTQRRVEMNWMK